MTTATMVSVEDFERRFAKRWDWLKSTAFVIATLVGIGWGASQYLSTFAQADDVKDQVLEAIEKRPPHPSTTKLEQRFDAHVKEQRAVGEALLIKQTRVETLLESELARRGRRVPSPDPSQIKAEDQARAVLGLDPIRP